MAPRHCALWASLAIFAVPCFVSVSDAAPRRSKPSPKTKAEQLADQGQEALDASKYEEAISLFTRARDLEPGPRWTSALAKAIAASGQLLRAKMLLTDTASRSRPELQPAFDATLAELEPRIPTLRVHVRGPAPGVATIELDGETREEITYGGTVQLDPGVHEVKVSAPGFETATQEFELAESTPRELTVTLALEVEDSAPKDFAPAPSSDVAWKRPVMTGSFVAAGVGLVAGTAFILRRNSKIGEANEIFDQCDPRVCSANERARIQSLDDQGTSAATFAIASYSVAAIAAGLGLALWLDEKQTNASNDAGVSFVLQPGMGVLKGRF